MEMNDVSISGLCKIKIKKTMIIVLFTFIILFYSSSNLAIEESLNLTCDFQAPSQSELASFEDFLYPIHGSIYIGSDDDFISQGYNGSGTASDPYIIENYTIFGGITVRDISKSFIIRNCYTNASGSGISLRNISVSKASIQNVYCENNTHGFYLFESSGVTILNSTVVRSSSYGIHFVKSDYCSVYYSRILEGGGMGIECSSSSHCNFVNNLFYRNDDFGIRIVNHYLQPAYFNNIFYNIFAINHNYGSLKQAYDGQNYNNWYNETSEKGNYWLNWHSGVIYSIDGGMGAADYFPLQPEETHDLDLDSLPDGWELYYNLDPFVDDSFLDTDADGLSNIEEFYFLLNPTDSDSDDDNIIDGEEVNLYNTDPNKSDTDNDGLDDYQEIFVYFTNPLNEDTDGDGKTDSWEIVNGFDPNIYDSYFFSSFLLYVIYIGSPILVSILLFVYIFIRRKQNIRMLKEYYQEQAKQLILLNEVFEDNKQQLKVDVNEVTEVVLTISQEIISNINSLKRPKRLFRILRRKWARKIIIKQGINLILLETIQGFIEVSKLFEYSFIQFLLDRSRESIENIKNLEAAYGDLAEVKSIISKNMEMFDQINTIFSFHNIYLSTIKNDFTKCNLNNKTILSGFESQITKLESNKAEIESKHKEIERFKTIERVLEHETSVSMEKLSTFLDFQTSEEMEKWMLDNFSSVPFTIEGDIIVFETEKDKEEIMTAIDSLLEEYEKWTEEGAAKKQ